MDSRKPSTGGARAKAFFGSLTFMYTAVLLVSMVLTVLFAYVYDTGAPTKRMATGTISPFPNALPIISQALPYAPTGGGGGGDGTTSQCVQLCPNSTGSLGPCSDARIQSCNQTSDCAVCTSPDNTTLEIACSTASAEVLTQQQRLGNNSPSHKYCLVKKETCGGGTLKTCRNDSDCIACDDLEGSKTFKNETMTCQHVEQGQRLSTITKDGFNSQNYTVAESGNVCLPELKMCNSETGSAKWSKDGWICSCDKYPGVYAGSDCSTYVACNNNLLRPWSKERQKLRLNVIDPESASAYKVGDEWKPDSGVDPLGCHDVTDPSTVTGVTCDAANPNLRPNAACQCDGVANGTLHQYRSVPGDPFTCQIDPCHGNSQGGKTIPEEEIRDAYEFQVMPAVVALEAPPGKTSAVYLNLTNNTVVQTAATAATDDQVVLCWFSLRKTPEDVQVLDAAGGGDDATGRFTVFVFYQKGVRTYLHGVMTVTTDASRAASTTGGGGGGLAEPQPQPQPQPQLVVLPYRGARVPEQQFVLDFSEAVTVASGSGGKLFTFSNPVLAFDENTNALTPRPTPAVARAVGARGGGVVGGGGGAAATFFIYPRDDALETVNLLNFSLEGQSVKTTCACSGRGSRIWTYDKDKIAENDGFTWEGRCTDVTIPGTSVVLPGDPAASTCASQPNSLNTVTRLVPGVSKSLTGGARVYDVCVTDPCVGDFADPKYDNPNFIGEFDDTTGFCRCGNPDTSSDDSGAGSVHLDASSCDRLKNPVCSYCKDACEDLKNRGRAHPGCGEYWASASSCGKGRCFTDTHGVAQCQCRASDGDAACKLYQGMYCINPVGKHECCKPFEDSKGVCADPSYECQTVLRQNEGPLENTFGVKCEPKKVDRVCYPKFGGLNSGFIHTCDTASLVAMCSDLPFVGLCGGPGCA